MEIFDQIINWASGLPLWQQTALVKILEKDSLDENEIKSLCELAVEEITDPDAVAEKAGDPLAGFKYEEKEKSDLKVNLSSISKTKNINAIKDGAELKFGDSGLTLVYGNNGTGKSGFSRVLKASCSCRDVEHVHGDVARESADEPTATINYSENGEGDSMSWDQYAKPDAALKTINIFDSRAARAYLHGDNDIRYVPAGLDVFDKLAGVFVMVASVIEEKTDILKKGMLGLERFFEQYEGTEVYELIDNLGREGDRKRVDELKVLSEEEIKRLTYLRKVVPDKEANGAVKRRERMALKYRRYGRLYNMLIAYKPLFQKQTIDELIGLRKAMFAAAKVAKEAGKEKFKSDEYLPGTGGDIWKELWQAAKDFSESTYHEHDFPNTENGAKCVLCQRSFDEPTAARFKSFHKFMTDKSQALAEQKKKEFEDKLSEYVNDEEVEDLILKEIFTELESDEYEHKDALADLAKKAAMELSKILEKLTSQSIDIEVSQPEINFDHASGLKALMDQIASEAKVLDVVKFTEILNKEKKELASLEARALLAKYDKEVYKEIASLAKLKALSKAKLTTSTTSVSRKAGEMKEEYLIESLKNSFDDEIKAIYDRKLIVELSKARTSSGVTYSEIVLSAEVDGIRISPDEVMSESEQKVISLAGYFAELSMAPHIQSAIVLDDPVTSLDHLNIEKIAQRIVNEARKRQVVVFTHNIVFATYLIDQADKLGDVAVLTEEISRMPKPGNVSEGLPWDALKTKSRIGKLKEKLQEITALYNKGGDNDRYQQDGEMFYKRLRETWERAVEEYLFADVVKRFKRDVETSRLRDVKIKDTDYDTVNDSIAKCSKYIHDNPEEESSPILEPERLADDLKSLEEWIADIKKR